MTGQASSSYTIILLIVQVQANLDMFQGGGCRSYLLRPANLPHILLLSYSLHFHFNNIRALHSPAIHEAPYFQASYIRHHLSGPADQFEHLLKRGVRIEKRKKQKTEDTVGRALSEYFNSPKFVTHSHCIPQAKGESKKDSLTMTQGKNKRSYFLNTQDIYLVTTP
ncbi:hypothetical protein I79_013955 [Cricetulus griseus]|uniref:Uncharacterized protein n=1 Tax=Cricetulus griseus TaxID=10029 RepID=G3HSV7_CRIGR|nr:hypothetical protein I79_013955 [Cricetulus griseus]